MIEFKIRRTGELEIVQRCTVPTVYLDHWAWRSFSENAILANRLTAALKSRNGTLALSWLNVVEFSKVTVQRQAQQVERLLQVNLPRIFFLEIQPFTVIGTEDQLLAGSPPLPPHADVEFLRVFAQRKPKVLESFTAHNLFSVGQNRALAQRFDRLKDSMVDRVEDMRRELGSNPSFRLAVKRPPSGPQIQRGTRFLLREMLRTLLVDTRMKVTPNHVIDLLHAVVPVSYCDLVLLDKHWEAQVARVRRRFAAALMNVPMARVFSASRNGVDRFLTELEER
jgi:hypothetical protein